jgi:hypothetical protein
MNLCLFLIILPFTQGLSQVNVVNRCPFAVFVKSVQQDVSQVQELAFNKIYSETYRPVINGTGVSITTNIKVGEEFDEQKRSVEFDNSPVTQLEYSYVPANGPVDLFYDISAIDDSPERQFCQYGYQLHTTSFSCDSVHCPARCDTFCPHVYNLPDDNWATHGCTSDVGLDLVLCTSYTDMP